MLPELADHVSRCPWVPTNLPLYQRYHDEEWGVPSFDSQYLFEMLCLEGAQAGLSWWTVLQKRNCYRNLFHDFNPELVAAMSDSELEEIVLNPGIIRHRKKVFSIRSNAQSWLEINNPVEWLWSYVDGKPILGNPKTLAEIPTESFISIQLSKDLRKRGFQFIGSKIIYAFMQATGMVNDHTANCFLKSSAP